MIHATNVRVMKGHAATWMWLLLATFALKGFAATTCTWTGGAGDGLWSSADNWKDGVKPSSDSTVYLSENGITLDDAGVAVMNNDIGSLSLERMVITNAAPLKLTGSRLALTKYSDYYDSETDPSESKSIIYVYSSKGQVEIACNIYITGQRAIRLGEKADLKISGDISDNSKHTGYINKYGPATSRFALTGNVTMSGYNGTHADCLTYRLCGGTNVIASTASPAGTTMRISGSGTVMQFTGGEYGAGWQIRNVTSSGKLDLLFEGTSTFKGAVVKDSTGGTLNLRGTGSATFENTLSLNTMTANNYMVGGKLAFNGEVAGLTTLTDSDASSHTKSTVTFNAKCPDLTYLYIQYYDVVCGCENVFSENMVLKWGYNSDTSLGVFDMNGYDQSIRTFAYTYDYGRGRVLKSDDAATLTLRPIADANVCARLSGAVSLVLAPAEAVTFALSNTVNAANNMTMSGDLIVSNGTLKIVKNVTVQNLSKIVLASGAGLAVESPKDNPIGTSATLFAENDSVLNLAVNATVKSARVGGVEVLKGDYGEGDLAIISGAGTLTVSESTYDTSYKGTGTGDWSSAANWTYGVPGNESSAAVMVPGATAQISSATAISNLYVGAAHGLATVEIAADATFKRAQIDEGGLLKGTAGVLAFKGSEQPQMTGGNIELSGMAAMTNTANSEYLNTGSVAGKRGLIHLTDTAKLLVSGNFFVGYGSDGYGEVVLEDSSAIDLGAKYGYQNMIGGSSSQSSENPAVGIVRMRDNSSVSLVAQGAGNYVNGIGFGSSGDAVTGANLGYLYLDGGAFSSSGAYSVTVVGGGSGNGFVYQTAGTFSTTRQLVIGFRGGTGVYQMTGGSYSGAKNYPVYVGGVATNTIGRHYRYMPTDRPGIGELSVSNATFATLSDLHLSAAGRGTLRVCGGGKVSATNLKLHRSTCNGETNDAQLTFCVNGDSAGQITLSGSLMIDDSAHPKLTVDLTRCTTTKTLRLLTASGITGSFGEEDVTLVGKTGDFERAIVEIGATSIKLYPAGKKGFLMIVR